MAQTRLAAIMFTDIVGYSAAMGKDEAAAMGLVRGSREIQKPLVEKYRGKWLKEMGDGVMAQFESALDAVKCAVEIQKNAKTNFKGALRIGIHLGDIIFENNDVYGEGVNVASRLESIADPGSIFLSDSVYHAIKSKGDIRFKYLGEKKLKNVEDPVRTYTVVESDLVESLSRRKGLQYLIPVAFVILLALIVLWPSSKSLFREKIGNPTIAVLPMTLVDGDPEDKYLEEGLTLELIASLGKINSISVINPHSSMQYMGIVQPLIAANRDLNDVDYFVTGSFEKEVNSIHLTLDLMNDREEMIWSEVYNWDIALTPGMVGRVATDISGAIDIQLNEMETSRITDIAPVNPEIYALWLKGMSHLGKFTPQGFAQGLVYLQEAVDKNPADARAWAGLAEGYVYLGHSPDPPPDAWHRAISAANRAIQLDSTLAEAWATLAHSKTYFEWEYEEAEEYYKRANELNPNLAMNHFHYAWHLDLFDRLDEAIVEHKRAQQLDPFIPEHTAWLGWLLEKAGKYEEAISEARKSMEIVKDFPLGFFILGHIYMCQEKYDSAITAFTEAAERQPNFKYMGLPRAFIRSGQIEKGRQYIDELENQPLNSFRALMLAHLYALIDNLDKFFEYANYEPAHAWAPWLRVNVDNPLIISDPRFKELMDKMNLPMPEAN